MENNLLYLSAKSYKKICNYQYIITLEKNKRIKKVTCNFDLSEFKHLSGIEKLNDIQVKFKNLSSKTLIQKIINYEIDYNDLQKSIYFNKKLNSSSENKSYTLNDRLKVLSIIYDLFHNGNYKIFDWLRNVSKEKRPFNSKISADYMFKFYSSDNKTISFFVESKNDKSIISPVSIFPTDLTYSNDGKISVSEYEILKIEEKDKTTGNINIIYSQSNDKILIKKEEEFQKEIHLKIKNDLKALKTKRLKYYTSNSETSKQKYENQKNIFKNQRIYTIELLLAIIDRLQDQYDDPHNSEVCHLILEEVDYIKSEINNRTGKSYLIAL